MKKVIVIFLVSVFISFKLSATKVKGVIIFTNNDTIEALIDIPTSLGGNIKYMWLQHKLIYWDENSKKHKIKATKDHNVLEFSFEYKGEQIRMVSLKHFYSKSWDRRNGIMGFKFLKVVVDGPQRLLFFKYSDSVNGVYLSGSRYVLSKPGEEPLYLATKMGFQNKASEYFEDCPELSNRLKNKEFKYNELPEVVHFYNDNCQ